VVGALLSAMIAGYGLKWIRAAWISHGVSYSVGAMLATVFLDLIPHGLEHASASHVFLLQMLLGIVFLFLLEKWGGWRHDHHVHDRHESVEHSHTCHHDSHKRSAVWQVLLGDGIHNFIDGVLIATAFLVSPSLGWSTALAIITHEIAQEVGDMLVLLHAGYSSRRAMILNILTGMLTLLGGLAGYFFLGQAERILMPLLAFVSANLLYVTISDLMPRLHQERSRQEGLIQGTLILLGIGTILATHFWVKE
jgi:zinc and cadmium transporter